jgi:hypothetical protein
MKLPVLTLMALFLAAASSCDESDSPTGPGPEAVAFETILQRSLPGQVGSTIREAARDQAAWDALWARLRQGDGALPEQPPVVDFQSEMVIVAAMETQACISRVTIRGIVQSRGELVVDLLEAPPAPNCVCITSERPLHVVRLRRSTNRVRFDVERGQTSC